MTDIEKKRGFIPGLLPLIGCKVAACKPPGFRFIQPGADTERGWLAL